MSSTSPVPNQPVAGLESQATGQGASVDVASEPTPPEAASANPAETADVPEVDEQPPARYYRRRVGLPIALFVLTCGSTFLAGATSYVPHEYMFRALDFGITNTGGVPTEPSLMPLRRAILANWREGLLYMGCVLAILLTHEMGHFVMTLVYRVRASLPFFVPLPVSPIGTMGAVIAMDSRIANRRQIFDIGLAGPLAGLVVALPIMWIGVQHMDLTPVPPSGDNLQVPLAMRLAIEYLHPGKYDPGTGFALTRANAWFMAGWVGLLVTGLNMLPVSQLDGGHVAYALLGRKAHWLARGFMAVACLYVMVMFFGFGVPPAWVLMIALVLFIGTDHPPTRDDSVRLGWLRTTLGYASLLIPIFCFVPTLQF
ncbi:MAG TPA: site-2 protease family protein [Pirellulaceae bacterium]|nr:site-2 protease family protein [Pirellulaceae bacterium]